MNRSHRSFYRVSLWKDLSRMSNGSFYFQYYTINRNEASILYIIFITLITRYRLPAVIRSKILFFSLCLKLSDRCSFIWGKSFSTIHFFLSESLDFNTIDNSRMKIWWKLVQMSKYLYFQYEELILFWTFYLQNLQKFSHVAMGMV